MNSPHNHEGPKASPEWVEVKQRQELPIDAHRDTIIEAVRSNPSSIIIGETGSGKTTRIPLFLLHEFLDAKIAVTSPRVLPALSVSEYVAEEGLGQKVGEEVGVITRQERTVSDATRLTFMTDGILLSMLRKDQLLMGLDIVMVDEAHERSLNIDLVLGLLKQAQEARSKQGLKELKIIVTSATIEEKKFSDYFQEAPPIKVPGRLYPIDVRYEQETNTEIPVTRRAAKKVLEVVSSTVNGDILIFMPGEDEIRKTIDEIEERNGNNRIVDFEILPLYGSMPKEEQKKVFYKNGKRKIIVATNVAETSVTIPGVRYVIDSGLAKQMNFNPITGIDELATIEISQANMNQRAGRAGRTGPGECFRLVSKEDFETREPFQVPEIMRANLSEVILHMKEMGIKNVADFDFIDKPSNARVMVALLHLAELGALDDDGNITEMGKEMSRLQMRPDLSRMLLEAKQMDEHTLSAMVDLCSMLSSTKPIFVNPNVIKTKNYEESESLRERERNQNGLKIVGSDLMTLINVWEKWTDSNYRGSFAYKHLLNGKALSEVGLARQQLLKSLGVAGIEVRHGRGEVDKNKIAQAILAGAPEALFFSQSTFSRMPTYEPFNGAIDLSGAKIFPGSVVFQQGGKIIIALNLRQSDSEKDDLFGGTRKFTNLWARTCHKLTIADLEKIKPGSVKKVPVGEPVEDWSGRDWKQRVDVYVLGKRIDEGSIIVPRPLYAEGLPPRNRFGSTSDLWRERLREPHIESVQQEVSYESNPWQISGLLSEIHERNTFEVIAKVKEYRERGGKHFTLSADNLDTIDDIHNNFYARVAKEKGIKTRADVLAHASDFELRLDDFITPEMRASIDEDSPDKIRFHEKTAPITYSSERSIQKIATVNIKDIEDIPLLMEVKLPAFSFQDSVILSLSRPAIYEAGRYRNAMKLTFSSFAELKSYYDQEKKAEEKRRRREERRDTERGSASAGNERIFDVREPETREEPPRPEQKLKVELPPPVPKVVIEKGPLTPEKKKEIISEVVDIKAFVVYLRGYVTAKTERELKQKENVLTAVKELVGGINSLIKELESEGVAMGEVIEGKLSALK
jgi:hypothetical protein